MVKKWRSKIDDLFGDWEIDTTVGPNNKGAMVTIVQRQMGFLVMEKLLDGENALGFAKCVINMLIPFKKYSLYNSR